MDGVQDKQYGAVHEYQLDPKQYQESTQQYQATAVQYQHFDQYQTTKQSEGSQQQQQLQQIYNNCFGNNQFQATVAEFSGQMQQQKCSQQDYQGSQIQCQPSQQCSQYQYQQEYQGTPGQYQPLNQGSLDQQSNQGSMNQYQPSSQRSLDERSHQQCQDATPNSLENQCNVKKNPSKCAFVVLLHGLPYSIDREQIMNFLSGCSIVGGKEGIHIVYENDGRLNGDAFVELSSEADVAEAIKKNRNHIGRRYIEVIESDQQKMEFALRQCSPSSNCCPNGVNDCIVRLRGLPYECSKEEIANFFLGLAIAPNGITLMTDHLGRTEREGFVQFASPDLIPKALEKHRQMIQHRYIEVYKSSPAELHKKIGKSSPWTGGRPGPYDRPSPYDRPGPCDRPQSFNNNNNNCGFGVADFIGSLAGLFNGAMCSSYTGGGMGDFGGGGWGMEGYCSGGRAQNPSQMGFSGDGRIIEGEQFKSETGHFILMKGLPYSATQQDIATFFEPLSAVNILLECNGNGRATGNAYVDFATYEDATQAMSKHRATMQHRYIELYFMEMGGRRFGRH